MQPDVEKEQEAIKFLQGRGYVIFQDSARIRLSSAERFDAYMLAQYGKRPGFDSHMRTKLVADMARHVMMKELVTFSKEPVGTSPCSVQIDYTARLDVFPVARKEWRR